MKTIPSTKMELSYNRINRIQGLDDLARLLFPGNRNHQKVFLAIFIELKYTPDQFLPSLAPLCLQHGFSERTLETVRSKMRRMGLMDHVSRFNKAHGYREGWVFSRRFGRALTRLASAEERHILPANPVQERKDRDLFRYL